MHPIISQIIKQVSVALICILGAAIIVNSAFAGPANQGRADQSASAKPIDKTKKDGDEIAAHEIVDKNGAQVPRVRGNVGALEKKKYAWEIKRKREIPAKYKEPKPKKKPGRLPMPFPPPPAGATPVEPTSYNGTESLFQWLAQSFFPKAAQAQGLNQYGDIMVDGDLSDWTFLDRLNLPSNLPPNLATGHELFAKYVATPEPAYLIALKADGAPIGPNTTYWLNSDQNPATGYQVWGAYGGAEYFVNVYGDGTVHLYNSNFQWAGALVHAYSGDQQMLEVAIPAAALGLTVLPQDVSLLGDINDTDFLFPNDWPTGGQYTIPGVTQTLPLRTDFSKQVGIAFCDQAQENFYDQKAYSQLFMALQYQATMAGIRFELMDENALTDISNFANLDGLVFAYCANVTQTKLDQIHDTLFKAVYHYGVGIIAADNFLTNDENGAAIPGDSYRHMKQLLGIGRENGDGPVDISIQAGDLAHPVMQGYTASEPLIDYKSGWYSYFMPVPGQPATILTEQTVTGSNLGTYPSALASETGGRNVHFATIGAMADTNLLWRAIQWVVYDNAVPVGLSMGREQSLLMSRVDMDQSQELEEVPLVEAPLLTILEDWKARHRFVGSFYINIGNDPAAGQSTDWTYSGPLYQGYIALGNEIGTHSYTHPNDTNLLTPAQIEFEFNQSINEIIANMGPATWRNEAVRGGAVPGAPENLATGAEIGQWLEYLTGGYSSFGAGYPGAFGSRDPSDGNLYLSPNLVFDFTALFFGVPVGNPPEAVPLTPQETVQYWANQYNVLSNHASQPIILWPWHDYCPTAVEPGCEYTMFEDFISFADNSGAEFLTGAELADRWDTFKNSNLTVTYGSSITASVIRQNNNHLGTFSLLLGLPAGQVIQSVNNWYAYDHERVFVDADGGTFDIALGGSQAAVSRISKLPPRARLATVTGNGNNLEFHFDGEGKVEVTLSQDPSSFSITGADSVSLLGGNTVELNYSTYGSHGTFITLN